MKTTKDDGAIDKKHIQFRSKDDLDRDKVVGFILKNTKSF